MDYKNNSNTDLIIAADCMLLSVEYIGNVHLFFNKMQIGYTINIIMMTVTTKIAMASTPEEPGSKRG